jgi:hypothetical protein
MSDVESMVLARFYSILVEAAVSGDYVTVPDLAKKIDILPSRGVQLAKVVNGLLWKVAAFEHKHNRPMLTAIVVKQSAAKGGKRSIYAGDGFYSCAVELGLISKDLGRADREAFWQEQYDAVHAHWNLQSQPTN